MKKPPIKIVKYYIALCLSLFILGGQPVEFGEEKTFFHGYLIQKPIIRIGLGVNLSEIKISSSSGVKIYEAKANYKLIADDVEEVLIRGLKGKRNEKFVIQVARVEEREDAEIIAQDLKTKVENKVYVAENMEDGIAGTFQVKVGDFLTREDALNFIKMLNQNNIKDTWILQEEISEGESRPLWILVNDELKSLSDDTVLYFIPSNPQSFLSFNGRDYRGIFVIKASSKGIVLINILNLEDYLKAVVPSELSPYSFSEMEAHKAQAVAARTYAIKNLGLNDAFGFDLDDTPKSQFYKGMNAEHPLSSLAVEQTRGEVALYNGKLIRALYTSSCGGMTENAEAIFKGPALPYLRSTECDYEKQRGWFLKSENTILPVYINGKNISPEIAALSSLRVIPQETDPFYFKERTSHDEVLSWSSHALDLVEEDNDSLEAEPPSLFYLSLGHDILRACKWKERVEDFIRTIDDTSIIEDDLEREDEDGDYQDYSVQEGPFFSSRKIKSPYKMNRGELVSYLWNILQSRQNLAHEGLFKGIDKDVIELEEEGENKQFFFSPDAFLLRNYEGDYSFASRIYLLGDEKVRWLENEGEILLLEVVYPPQADDMDPSSAHRSWQVRISREELEKKINQYYPIGELMDIVPQIRGVSDRVVELLITGSEAQAVVEGLRIRWVLGLRETLFSIDREYDEEERVAYFTFTGRGWGHGVGLCQVGAFGMAWAGADYKEILKKYYKGITISKIY